jgi:chloramphenicol 3-O-phosphotransferase
MGTVKRVGLLLNVQKTAQTRTKRVSVLSHASQAAKTSVGRAILQIVEVTQEMTKRSGMSSFTTAMGLKAQEKSSGPWMYTHGCDSHLGTASCISRFV